MRWVGEVGKVGGVDGNGSLGGHLSQSSDKNQKVKRNSSEIQGGVINFSVRNYFYGTVHCNNQGILHESGSTKWASFKVGTRHLMAWNIQCALNGLLGMS
jgi:hypothetical protein